MKKYILLLMLLLSVGHLFSQNDMRTDFEETKIIDVYNSFSFTDIINNKVEAGDVRMGGCTERDFTFNIEKSEFNLKSPEEQIDYISGTITSASLKTTIIDCGPLTYLFKENDLNLTLGGIKSVIHPVLGGEINFEGRKLWINNITDVFVSNDSVSGVLYFKTYAGLNLKDAALRINDSEIVKVSLKSTTDVEFEYELNSKEFLIKSGVFEVNNFNIRSEDKIILNDFNIEKPNLNLRKLKLTFNEGKVFAKMNGLKLSAQLIKHNANPNLTINLSESFAIKSGEFKFNYNREGFSLTDASINDLQLRGNNGTYIDDKGMNVDFDKILLKIDKAGLNRIEGNFAITDAKVAFVEKENPINNGFAHVKKLDLKFSGKKDNLKGEGDIEIEDINMRMATDIDISSTFNKCGDGKVPAILKARIGNLKGPVSLSNGRMNVKLRTNLIKANMNVDKYECVYVENLKVPTIVTKYLKVKNCLLVSDIPFLGEVCEKVQEEIVAIVDEVIKPVDVELKLTIEKINTDVDMTDVTIYTNDSGEMELCGGGIRKVDLTSLFIVSLAPTDVRVFGLEVQNVMYPIIDASTAALSQTIYTAISALSIVDFGAGENLNILEKCD